MKKPTTKVGFFVFTLLVVSDIRIYNPCNRPYMVVEGVQTTN